jgi:hypothetical protein
VAINEDQSTFLPIVPVEIFIEVHPIHDTIQDHTHIIIDLGQFGMPSPVSHTLGPFENLPPGFGGSVSRGF